MAIFKRHLLACIAFVAALNVAHISFATPFTMDVCVIPLSTLVHDLVKKWMGTFLHLYVRGADNTGLNFQPRNKIEFMGGEAMIGRQVYPQAICHPFYSTNNKEEYDERWQQLVNAYEEAAKKYEYSIFGMECQKITKAIFAQLGYTMPAPIVAMLDEQKACVTIDLAIIKPFVFCADQS